MAQYKVPQNTQRDDQIFGPFTLRQFLYILGGGMAGYMVFIVFNRISSSTAIMLGLMSFMLVASFAVLKVQGMALPEYLTALIVYLAKPRRRIWQKDIFTPDIAFFKTEEVTQEQPHVNPAEVKSRLDQLAHVLDTRGWSGIDNPDVQKTQVAAPIPLNESNNAFSNEQSAETLSQSMDTKKDWLKKPDTKLIKQLNTEQEQEVAESVPPVAESVPPVAESVPPVAESVPPVAESVPPVAESVPPVAESVPQGATAETLEQTDKILSARTKIEPPTDQEQQNIERLLQIQEKRERLIQQEMGKMEQRLMGELKKKFEKESQVEAKEQQKEIKSLKSIVQTIEKKVVNKEPAERIKKAEIRVAPPVEAAKPTLPDYSNIMEGRITTVGKSANNTSIKVDESQLDDILSEIDNPTTDEDFNKLSEAILAKRHTTKHAKIIKENNDTSTYDN
ncbi:hypothetical protein HGB13_01055 [bacterium]|nr:hypothetical protein [bacterium]